MFVKATVWVLLTLVLAAVAFGAVQNDKPADAPEPEGKKILDTACTVCHSLKEVEKFKGFYKKEDWQDVVVTMVKYGADVKDEKVPVLVDYLAKTYSPETK
jgi:uncharacterized protein (DUF169 family)